jgi:hypothetical protein
MLLPVFPSGQKKIPLYFQKEQSLGCKVKTFHAFARTILLPLTNIWDIDTIIKKHKHNRNTALWYRNPVNVMAKEIENGENVIYLDTYVLIIYLLTYLITYLLTYSMEQSLS